MAPESGDDQGTGSPMRELALFTGAGGGLLGTRLLGWRPVCAVEFDPYCQEVLMRRQEEGHLEAFPIWDDVRTFDGGPWRGAVDVVTGGFPCQPFSAAGKGLGIDDPRNMWPDTIRIIREVRPRYCLLENVPALLAHEYFGTIIGELQESGYCVRWKVISAAEMGAPHKRDRVWIVGDTADLLQHGGRGQRAASAPQVPESGDPGRPDNVADSNRTGSQGRVSGIVQERASERAAGEGNPQVADPKDSDRRGSNAQDDEGRGHQEAGGRGISRIRPEYWLTEPALGWVADVLASELDESGPATDGELE